MTVIAMVLVPDLDDEITAVLTAIEETLLQIRAYESECMGAGDDLHLPRPLAREAALEAVRRLWEALAPSQGERARSAWLGKTYAPDGRYEHTPLRVLHVDQADVEILAATAKAFANPGDPYGVVADIVAGFGREQLHGEDLVMRTAQLAGVLDLEHDDDSRALAKALTAAGPTADLVLTAELEEAYGRFVDRFNHMWTLADPLARWQY